MNHLAAIQAPQQVQTTATPASGILQRKCACGNHTVAGGECAECRKKRMGLQRKAANHAEPTAVPPIVHEVLRSPGQPLDAATRAFMEPRFGRDFSRVRVRAAAPQVAPAGLAVGPVGDRYEQEADRVADTVMRKPESSAAESRLRNGYDFGQVRIHTDTKAAESARAVNALAYTVGRNVVFGAGQYAPETMAGQHLLAHELTHVVQQESGAVSMLHRLECKDEPTPHIRLVRGSVHSAVFEAQRKLNLFHKQETDAGRPGLKDAPLVVDCIFGQKTFNAVLSFQEHVFPGQPEHHVGQIGDRTWAQLDAVNAPASAPPPAPAPPSPPAPTSPVPLPVPSTIKVWVNSFIPHAQLPDPLGSNCFRGDNRGFSNAIHAPSRTHQEIEFETTTLTKTIDFKHVGTTHEINCTSGAVINTATAPRSGLTNGSVVRPSASDILVDFQAAASDPLVLPAPAIDLNAIFHIDPTRRQCVLDIEHDGFPAYEAYVTADGGAGVTVHEYDPRTVGEGILALFPPMDKTFRRGPVTF